ncbi:MAG: hypothetical protein R6W76_04595 [Caldilinea sp.]
MSIDVLVLSNRAVDYHQLLAPGIPPEVVLHAATSAQEAAPWIAHCAAIPGGRVVV